MQGHKPEADDEGRSDTTIGDLLGRRASKVDPTEDLHDLRGFPRLEAIAQVEFASKLDLQALEKLRGLLSSFQHLSTDFVDELALEEAAELLEIAEVQSPSGRLIDQVPATCARCGGQLSDEERAWMQGWCGNCRTSAGKVNELDIAFRTETRSYDKFGRDPLDRIAEWPAISTYICNKYSVHRVELIHWDRFLNEYQTDHAISRESLLIMELTDLVAGLDPRRKPKVGKKSKIKKKGRPPDTDLAKDRRIYEAWKTGSCASYEDLRKSLGLSSKSEVKQALDRHRKRLGSAGKKPPRKPRQEP
jgi:hypothetical protein